MTRAQVSRRRDTRVRSVRRLTAGFLHHRAPVWSPDGHLVGFTVGRGLESHWLLTDRKGRAARVLPGPVVGGASMAPDHSVAYGRQVGATAEIWVLPAIEAQPQRLLGGDGRLYRDPAYSPDGRFLCYAADDGPDSTDSPLRLWMVELARLEHTLLVAEPPAIAGATGPVRAGHPVWSPACDWVFFDVTQGEQSAVAVVSVQSRTVQLLTGPGFCSPAPIAAGVLCVERVEPDGLGEVCILQYRAPRPPTERPEASTEEPDGFKVRTTAIAGISPGAREPAVVVGKKGVVHLAWIAPGRPKGGEPQRYDVHTGQLVRLPLLRAPRATLLAPDAGPEPGAALDQDGDASIVRQQSAAVAAGLSAKVKPKAKAKRDARVRHGGKAERGGSGALEGAAGDEAPADAERGV